MVEYVFRIQLPPAVSARPRVTREEGAEPAGAAAGSGAAQGGNLMTKKKPQEKYANLKVGRNDPCPCGSGKKYKKCHGA
ncbi:MAG TPA: hypothetical protein DCZ93_12565 [Elusimicrobia bacterium]|nr:hypothetical protein [Elusimicrobiota bacterium]